MTLVDLPGFNNSYGFYKILLNLHFHLIALSIIPNLKFILTFNMMDLYGTGERFILTILNFIDNFDDFGLVLK